MTTLSLSSSLYLTKNLVSYEVSADSNRLEDFENKITPFKFFEWEDIDINYQIPHACKFQVPRLNGKEGDPDINYYFTKPDVKNYPIAILCEGSSIKDSLVSVIHFHRYFLEEFLNLKVGVLTLEQWGIDGLNIQQQEFIDHYTRSQRLSDHETVVEHLQKYPPQGWNGQFIFMGVSEGGVVVTSLTEKYSEKAIAAMNFSGAGELPWSDQLWLFIEELLTQNPNCPHSSQLSGCKECLKIIGSRGDFDAYMNLMVNNQNTKEFFMGMSFKYHSDALAFPPINYQKLNTPYLVVAGEKDSAIKSFDAFVEQMKENKKPVSYLRIFDMDHFVRKRPDVVEKAFEWLSDQIKSQKV